MTKPFVVGNWKMNTSLQEAIALAGAVQNAANARKGQVDIGICPPYPWLVPVREALHTRSIQIGAQDVAAAGDGAFTGDVSASMLAACSDFVLVGHSERRMHHGESNELIRDKIRHAHEADLAVMLCVGESKDERNANEAETVVNRQLDVALDGLGESAALKLSIAYEPVWAIGTGVAATTGDASQMAEAIRENLERRFAAAAASIRILYGGSANDQNAGEFLAAEGVDGLLVGGASLKPDVFASMIAQAAQASA